MKPAGFLAALVITLVVNIVFVILRIWIRINRTSRKGSLSVYTGEVFIVLAIAIEIFYLGTEIWRNDRTRRLKAQYPGQDVSKMVVDVTYKKLYFAEGLLYTTVLWLVKGSFICMYFEVYSNLAKRIRYSVLAMTAFLILGFLASIILHLSWCRPIATNWEIDGTCNTAIALPINTNTTALNMASDIGLLALFVGVLRRTRIHNRELYGAVFVSVIGTCTLISSAVRYAIIFKIIKTSVESDENLTLFLFWTYMEIRLFVFAACLPACRVFLRTNKERQRARWWASAGSSLTTGNRIFGKGLSRTGRPETQSIVLEDTIRVTTEVGISYTGSPTESKEELFGKPPTTNVK